MELINQTGVPAELVVSDHGSGPDGMLKRAGLLVAKATFAVRQNGTLELVTDDPYPVLRNEEPTALGILPRDVVPPECDDFEVLVLGAAYAPQNAPVPERSVCLWVGDTRDDLDVIGERTWLSNGEDVRMTSPVPFARMPLSWERAFGGTARVWVDESTPIPLSHNYNSLGRGFDPTVLGEGLGEQLGSPEGFPRIEYERQLPNIENPRTRIAAPTDDPTPCCWAPMPFELGLRAKPSVDAADARAGGLGICFANAPWRMENPPAPLTSVGLTGCRPLDRAFAFRWPAMRVFGDYVLGQKVGVRNLIPRMLVLLPEEERFTVTYRDAFAFGVREDGLERSFRLRLED